MDFFQLIAARRSIRAFRSRPIEPEVLQRVLEAANSAPSAGNLQAYQVFVVRDPERKAALAGAAWGQGFVSGAAVDLVFCASRQRSGRRYGERGRNLYSVQDATIACTFAMLASADLGLASTWVGAFDDRGVAEAIGAGNDLVPVAILALGYGAEEGYPTSRRKLTDLVHGL